MVHGGTKPDHKFVRRRPRLSRGAGIYVSRPIRIWLLPACAVRSCPRSRKDAFAAFRASRPEKVNRRVPQRYPRFLARFCNDTPVSRRDSQQITEYPYFDKCSKKTVFRRLFNPIQARSNPKSQLCQPTHHHPGASVHAKDPSALTHAPFSGSPS